jgi:hypothetical protein
MSKMNIWFSALVVLTAYLCVSVGWRWYARAVRRRAWKREWSNGVHGVSAVLPERLRRAGLSGAPAPARYTPAHRCLIVTARQVVAQMAFFRRPGMENPAVASHETEKHSV